MFKIAFFGSKNYKLPPCPSMNEWLNCGIPIIKNTFYQLRKKKNSMCVIWTDVEMKNRLWVAKGRAGRVGRSGKTNAESFVLRLHLSITMRVGVTHCQLCHRTVSSRTCEAILCSASYIHIEVSVCVTAEV